MNDITQLSQQDEALRRARSGADPFTAGLDWVANRLTDRAPAADITAAALLAIVRGWSVQMYDWSEEADALDIQIRTALPEIRSGETRGEYALRVRAMRAAART